MTHPLKLCVAGANGRMGRTLVRLIAEDDNLVLTGATTRSDDPDLGRDVGLLAGGDEQGLSLTDDIEASVAEADGVVDFTMPQAMLLHGRAAAAHDKFLVSGTTGIDGLVLTALHSLATRMPVLHAGNFSLGVAVLSAAVEQAARILGPDYDVEIIDTHHRHKVDAPSGTALMLGEAAARAVGKPLDDIATRGRDGITGAREAGTIGFSAVRGGSVIGAHDVVFAGPSERLVFSHIAEDRSLFARGALKAAQWLAGRPPGLYSVSDMVLPEKSG